MVLNVSVCNMLLKYDERSCFLKAPGCMFSMTPCDFEDVYLPGGRGGYTQVRRDGRDGDIRLGAQPGHAGRLRRHRSFGGLKHLILFNDSLNTPRSRSVLVIVLGSMEDAASAEKRSAEEFRVRVHS